jgi:hypothetical protein
MRNSERGGIIGGLLIAGLAVLCLAVIAGVFVARNIRISTSTHNGGDDVVIDTPAGHLSVRAHDDAGWASPDIPKYPGAHSGGNKGGNAVVEWNSRNAPGDRDFTVSASELITADPAGKVFEYYRNQLPAWVVAENRDGEMRLELKQGRSKRIVTIHEQSDGTHIGVASVGEPASN